MADCTCGSGMLSFATGAGRSIGVCTARPPGLRSISASASATGKSGCAGSSCAGRVDDSMDEQQRGRIHDDLRGIVKGELLFDELSRALYSTDASIFQVRPLGVAAPRDEEDVQALVRYGAEHQVPLVPRGAGTGVAGESLGPGLVI